MTRPQLTLAGTGFEKYTKVTRRTQLLAEMDRVVPWRELCARIEPVYPKPGNGRPPIGLERMLRMYFLQHWVQSLRSGAGRSAVRLAHDAGLRRPRPGVRASPG